MQTVKRESGENPEQSRCCKSLIIAGHYLFFLNHCSLKAQVREGCFTMPIEDEPEDLPVYYFMIA